MNKAIKFVGKIFEPNGGEPDSSSEHRVDMVFLDDNGVALSVKPLPLHLELENHSPTGFSWGYAGSGPHQLALAILYEYYKLHMPVAIAKTLAGENDHKLVCNFIAKLPQNKGFELDEQTLMNSVVTSL